MKTVSIRKMKKIKNLEMLRNLIRLNFVTD